MSAFLRPRAGLQQLIAKVDKRVSATDDLAAFAESMRFVNNDLPPRVLLKAQEEWAHVQEELSGLVRRTSYRHQVVEMDAGEVFQGVSSAELGQRLLYSLVTRFCPTHCVEFGSAFGTATVAIAGALPEGGRIEGIELEEWRADIANRTLQALAPDKGKVFVGSIEEVFPRLRGFGGFDFAFVDAEHRYDACMKYCDLLRPRVAHQGLIVFDDIDWSGDMRRFWRDLCRDEWVQSAALFNGRWGVIRCHRPTN